MIAESICKELKIKLNNNNLTGIIHSVFKNALNIMTYDNDFITLITIDKPMAPYAVRILGVKSFLDYELKKDMKISSQNEYIWLENLNIKIIFDKAHLWDPMHVVSYIKGKREPILIKIRIMEHYLLDNKNFISPFLNILNKQYKGFELFSNEVISDKEYDFIKERFLRFMKAFIQEEESITELTKGIIGYGQGLTPSIDDFICGLMVSNIYLTHYFNKNIDNSLRFNSSIIKDIVGRTTRVSEEMLKFSAKGYVNEDIRNLVISLISTTSIVEFEENLKKVASFGYSSGIDIISGIYTCSNLLFNQYRGGMSWEV